MKVSSSAGLSSVNELVYIVADDTIFGGIKIDTEHQQRVNLAVQKVIACSTMSGYVPQFNQQASLSGCLTHTPFITKSYTILVSHV